MDSIYLFPAKSIHIFLTTFVFMASECELIIWMRLKP